MKQNLKNLKHINLTDSQEFGGKAASLGEMIDIGIPILPGFALSTNLFNTVLKKIQKRFPNKVHSFLNTKIEELGGYENTKKISEDLQQKLLGISSSELEKISEIIETSKISQTNQFLIIRSSATVEDSSSFAFAGQFKSVVCQTKAEEIAKAIRKVWCSSLEARVKLYCERSNCIYSDVLMGVAIQKFIQPEVSGLLFTKNPVKKINNWGLIEYAEGSAEKIVGGEITPSRCRVNMEDISFLWEYKRENRPLLSKEILEKVVKLGIKTRKHFRKEIDIEWAIKDQKIIFFQARPITTNN